MGYFTNTPSCLPGQRVLRREQGLEEADDISLIEHSSAENIFKEATSLDPLDCCLTHLEAVVTLGTGTIALFQTAQELGVCSSKNVSLKDRLLFSDQLSTSIGHMGISFYLWKDWQVGISWYSICPVHCCPSWQRLVVAGSGQTGPGRAESSPLRVRRARRCLGRRQPLPCELREEPRSPPEQRPGRSGTACTALGRCCREVTGMGCGPADLGVNGGALTAPTREPRTGPAAP